MTPNRDNLPPAPTLSRQGVYRDAQRATNLGLIVNLGLLVLKIAGGIFTSSSALLAEAVNSLGDVASAVAVRVSLHLAQRDEDDDHPYGHTKAESIAGLSVALVIIGSALVFGLETLQRLGQPSEPIALVAGAIAMVCAVVKEAAYQYVTRSANQIGSASLQAVAVDHRSDAISSLLIAVSLLASTQVPQYAAYIDSIIAILVCLYLMWIGGKAYISIATELMDQQADDRTVSLVRRVASEVDQVVEVEKLRVRKSGLEFFVEIHVQVDGRLSVEQGHHIGHNVKDRLVNQIPRLRDVHVHVEPSEPSRVPLHNDLTAN